MMTKPGITELDKYVDSRYTLVSMVAKRARMICTDRRANETVETAVKNAALDKPVTQAVEEEAPTEQVQDISLYPPIQLSYVEIENLKSMAKAKVLSDDYEGAYDIFMKLVG